MAGADWGPGSGTRIYPYYLLYWLFGNLFSLDGYLVQPRYCREDLGPSPKQCALPALRSGRGWGARVRWKKWEEGKEWELGWEKIKLNKKERKFQ